MRRREVHYVWEAVRGAVAWQGSGECPSAAAGRAVRSQLAAHFTGDFDLGVFYA